MYTLGPGNTLSGLFPLFILEFPVAHRFLHEIQLNCAVNKMSVDNLATVIGVNLIRSKVEDPAVIMRGTQADPAVQRGIGRDSGSAAPGGRVLLCSSLSLPTNQVFCLVLTAP